MGFYERREKIKEILRRKGRVQCAELAEEFLVSKNTILNGGYEFAGDGSTWLNARQTEYLYTYMRKHNADPTDETFKEILDVLEHAKSKM